MKRVKIISLVLLIAMLLVGFVVGLLVGSRGPRRKKKDAA